jgi:four helix bundle protein
MEQGNTLLQRTKRFALRVIRLVDALPNTRAAEVIGRQLLRSATSIGANYRAARRGRSTAEFCAKLGVAEEEADESVYWLELLSESNIMRPKLLADLLQEAHELTAILVTSIRTARRRKAERRREQEEST